MPLPERSLISEIRRLALRTRVVGRGIGRGVLTGIGDDCAILAGPDRWDLLVTTDFTLEGVHFRRDWHPPESVGHRCLARGLSDIAAMAGEPAAVFLSLALPRDLRQSWVTRFVRSLINLAKKYGATLAGGDTAESPDGILADIIVIGTVPKGKAIFRSGARPGDRVYISGQLGGSAAAVLKLRARPEKKLDSRAYVRHFYPEPRVELGRVLREKNLASAMIDTSDGLSTDLSHICGESRVGAEIDSSLIPRARIGKHGAEVDLDLALHGGEDYELLFTAPSTKRVPKQISGVPITEIGLITRSRAISVRDAKGVACELRPRGWQHFRE